LAGKRYFRKTMLSQTQPSLGCWEIIADNLKKAGWTCGSLDCLFHFSKKNRAGFTLPGSIIFGSGRLEP